ncbi:MAG: type II toxin-antitoxin system RelE/ParE family toxin [Thermomicrobia bacterium]|nr:type II toxin-antitoxin system RelE/ParE family toxin [Thermomicrobia bacterium]
MKKIQGDLWELRLEFGGTEYRLFFGIDNEKCVFTHAIV